MTFRLSDMAFEPDIQSAADRGEGIAAIQPMKIGERGSRFRDAVDLALELTTKSAGFRKCASVSNRGTRVGADCR